MEKRLQLIVSDEVIAEYLEIFEQVLDLVAEIIEEWRTRFYADSRSSFHRLFDAGDASCGGLMPCRP